MPNRKDEKGQMFEKGEEYSDIVRFPVKLFVDGIEFEPTTKIDVVRTAYDLDISPHDIKRLYAWLKVKLENDPYTPARIRVIGRLVS